MAKRIAQRWGEYLNWIATNVKGDPTGRCLEVSALMVGAFPELTRVRGHYFCPFTNKEHPHWWCVAPSGDIVDPTAAQFPSHGEGEYIPHDEERGEPQGKCRDCGAYVYVAEGGIVSGEVAFCNESCERRYIAYVTTGRL